MPQNKEKEIEKQVHKFADKYSPEICRFVKLARLEIKKIIPNAIELVYDNYNALAFAFGPSERASEAILSIATYPKWVSIFFSRGTKLSDPKELLKGSGNKMRHFVLDERKIAKNPYLVDLIHKAVESHPTALPPTKGYTVIKSIALKQRPRRTETTRSKKSKTGQK
jgi:hypothetical protein